MIVEKMILLAMDGKKLLAPVLRVWRRNLGVGFAEESGRFGSFMRGSWVVDLL